MPIDSVPALIAALRESNSLAPTQMEELKDSLRTRYQLPRLLAKELLDRGWLTAYQLNQLFQGRGRDLNVGPYLLLERLGEGGMGQVFKARHRHLGRTVALKIIRKDRLDSPETVRRFQREIEMAAKLTHPNIVAAYDAGEVGGTRYIAFEYVEGIDLSKLVKQSGPLSIVQACYYVRQAALGLQHAFERGLVHRDIKPSNLFVTGGPKASARVEPGVVKILDMGLARLQGPEGQGENLTQFQTTLGTPDFMAPEQARDARAADIRADLYSLGCTFYFLLSGRVPFPGTAPMEKLLKHWMEEPTPLEELRPEVPSDVAVIVRKLMAKLPEDRYQAPIELVAALTRVLGASVTADAPPAQPALRSQDDPLRPGRVPTPVQETIIPSDASDTDEGPIIRMEFSRDRKPTDLARFVIAGIAIAVLTMLLVMLLCLN